MGDSNTIREKLEKRHKERLETMEQRRQARLKEKIASGESASIFLDDFNKAKREILVSLNLLDTALSKNDLSTEFDKITKKIQSLQKYVSDSAMFLPSYDMRRAQEISTQMRMEMNKKRDELLPKKKFAFKSRQKMKPIPKNDGTPEYENIPENNILKNIHGFSNESGKTLTLSFDQCNEKDINLSNLVDCIVYIYGFPSAVRIKNVINSEVYCGPVSRSIFIMDCYDCIYHLACQQLRIHNTSNTKFFIHVTSKAIIEDCEEVGFGRFYWHYPLLDEHFTSARLNIEVNNWSDVDDFNWLKLDEKSPNWYAIEQ